MIPLRLLTAAAAASAAVANAPKPASIQSAASLSISLQLRSAVINDYTPRWSFLHSAMILCENNSVKFISLKLFSRALELNHIRQRKTLYKVTSMRYKN